MFTHRNIQDTNERGALMIEAIALLGLMTMMSPMVVRQTADRTSEMEEVTIAGQMKELKDALSNYISANYSTLANSIKTSALNHRFTVTAVQLAPYLSADLIEGNNFRGNKFMSDFKVGIRAQCTEMRRTDGASPAGVTTSGGVITAPNPTADQYCSRYRMTGVVLSEGDELDDRRAARIASMIGADGGSMRSSKIITALGYNGNAAEKQKILGTQGVWEGDVSHYFAVGGNTGINTDVGGRVAATTTYSSGFSGDYLYRKPVDGLPDANSMFTDLDMGGATNCNGAGCHTVNNAGGLEVVGGRILIRSRNNAQGTNNMADDAGLSLARIALDTANVNMGVTGGFNMGVRTYYANGAHQTPTQFQMNAANAHLYSGDTSIQVAKDEGVYLHTYGGDTGIDIKSGGTDADQTISLYTTMGASKMDMNPTEIGMVTGSTSLNMTTAQANLNVGTTTFGMANSEAQLNAGGTILSLNSTAARTSIGNAYTHLAGTSINMGVNDSWIRSNLQIAPSTIAQTISGTSANSSSIVQRTASFAIQANTASYGANLEINPTYPLMSMSIQDNAARQTAYLGVSPLGAISLQKNGYNDQAKFFLFSNYSQLSFTNNMSQWRTGVNQGITSTGGKAETYVQKNQSVGASFALTATDFNIDIRNALTNLSVVTKQKFSYDSNGLRLFSTNQADTSYDSAPTIVLNAKTGRVSGTVFQPEDTIVIASNGQRGGIVRQRLQVVENNSASGYTLAAGSTGSLVNASNNADASVIYSNLVQIQSVGGTTYNLRTYEDHAYTASGNGSTETNYNRYRVDPAFVSVMNDIKLTSRGGARLSEAMPNYILKGIYQLTNSYTAGPWPCVQTKDETASGGSEFGADTSTQNGTCTFSLPRYSLEQLGLGGGGWEFRCPSSGHPIQNGGGSCNAYGSDGNGYVTFNYYQSGYKECPNNSECWAHPFMGMVPAPGRTISHTYVNSSRNSQTEYLGAEDEGACPNGYTAVMTLTPSVFDSGRVLAYDFNKIAGSSITRYNPGYLDYSNSLHRNVASILQPATGVFVRTKEMYNSSGYIKGWKVAMGTYTLDINGNYAWNVGGVIPNTMSAIAHTYCYFNPYGFQMPNMQLMNTKTGGRTHTSLDNPMLNSY